MNKLKLNIEFDYDFVLLGVCSHEMPYKFCWSINNLLKINFIKDNDIVMVDKKSKVEKKFTLYSYYNEEMFTDYFIIVNRSENSLFIPEQKKIDFFIKIQGNISAQEKKELIEKINKLPNIITVIDIDPNELKSKQNLIF